jgi:protein ImuB
VPSPEDLSTLLARLGALMGESRIGAPVLLDTHDTRQVGQEPFNVKFQGTQPHASGTQLCAPSTQHTAPRTIPFVFRRFPLPLVARVTMVHGTPVRIDSLASGVPGGVVIACAGPWRMSGGWWTLDRTHWDRDEWDVELATGGVYRLARLRTTGLWEIEGMFD